MPCIGHILTSDGIQADPAKIQAILNMQPPNYVAGVRRILGTGKYLAKFLPHLSEASEPLGQLTKKEQPFGWDSTHDQAFASIKHLISYHRTTCPEILRARLPSVMPVIMAWVNEKPIAFASRALTDAERNYAQIEKELLPIVYETTRFH